MFLVAVVMEEKERYVYEEQENGYYFIYDNYEERYLNVVTNCKILNQQDKRIKELEQENKQLKQQLAITEKALELACEHIKEDLKCDDTENEIYNYFKTKAKEMLENE